MKPVTIRPGKPEDLPELLALSAQWAEEEITYGYAANGPEDFQDYRVWAAELDGRVIGYAAGQMETAKHDSSIQKAGDRWFELEELYVAARYRSEGIGGLLLHRLEEELRLEGVGRLMLTAANRDSQKLLRFYLEDDMMGYSFRMFKEL